MITFETLQSSVQVNPEKKTGKQVIEGLRALEDLDIPEAKGIITVCAILARNRVADKFLDAATTFRTSPPSDQTPNFSMDSRSATGDPKGTPLVRIVNYGNSGEPTRRTTAIHVEPSTGDHQGCHIDILLPVDEEGRLATHGFPEATISKEEIRTYLQNGVEQEVRFRTYKSYRPGRDKFYEEDESAVLGIALRESITATLEFLEKLPACQAES